MNSIKTLYKLMEVSSRDLEIPDAYQRKLNTERVAKIVAGFNERIANEPKVSFRDGHYYVFDGQHTIVARKHMNGNNDLPILCKVYYGMTEADEALLYAPQTEVVRGKIAPKNACIYKAFPGHFRGGRYVFPSAPVFAEMLSTSKQQDFGTFCPEVPSERRTYA